MSMFFAENPGKIEIVPWYADNEIYLQEVRFSVPASEWNEFQESDLFQELVRYVDSLQTQDTHIDIHEPRYIAEIEASLQNRTSLACRESAWVRVRNLFRRRK